MFNLNFDPLSFGQLGAMRLNKPETFSDYPAAPVTQQSEIKVTPVGLAVSKSKCNNIKFISPVSFEVKSAFRKEKFGWTFPV